MLRDKAGAEMMLQEYERNGFVVARAVIDRDLVDEARSHVDWLIKRNPDVRPELLDTQLVRDDPFWVRLVSDDRLLDLAQAIIGSDIALFASHYIAKPPHTGQPVLWHQDGAYWPLEPMEVVTAWLAVSDSTRENGCMRVIPSSHTSPLLPVQERADLPNVLSSSLGSDAVDPSRAVDVCLEPGDVSLHHPLLMHGSEPNRSDHWRLGLTIRYIPTSTRIKEEGAGAPFLLRGNPVPGVNRYLERPKYRAGVHMPFSGCRRWA